MTWFVDQRVLPAFRLAKASLKAGTTVFMVTAVLVAQAPPDKPRITTAPGFAVDEIYLAEKSGSVLAITFDSEGRLAMARDRGPIVTLIDKDNDGRIDEERVFTNEVVNCQGLLFDGDTLYAVGVGAKGAGLYRVTDENKDGRGDRVELMTANSDSMGEHGPHAVFFGPSVGLDEATLAALATAPADAPIFDPDSRSCPQRHSVLGGVHGGQNPRVDSSGARRGCGLRRPYRKAIRDRPPTGPQSTPRP